MNHSMKTFLIILAFIASLAIGKVIWVRIETRNHGTFETEKTELLQRRNYLLGKIKVAPQQLIDEMPASVGRQFQGEWALYSLSMLTMSLHNLSILYPETRDENLRYMSSLIDTALAPDIRYYDSVRWFEDPLETLDRDDESHISYLSHIAWMISNYKAIGGSDKHDALYHQLCATMNRRLLKSDQLNLPTYPCEPIYVPDMLVAIVALSNYARQNNGCYQTTVDQWIERAQTEWLDEETGLLKSFLPTQEFPITFSLPILGAYSSLNCYYLALIDEDFARSQYNLLKRHFVQTKGIAGIKEYHDRSCWLGMSVDAGPILFNLAPSGTAFGIGCATYFNDADLRKSFLKTAEMAGSSITKDDQTHYLLANIALVGEAITLAMRTTTNTNMQ